VRGKLVHFCHGALDLSGVAIVKRALKLMPDGQGHRVWPP
jgi:hypothetical protein